MLLQSYGCYQMKQMLAFCPADRVQSPAALLETHVRRTGRDRHVTGRSQMTQHKASLLSVQDAVTKYQLFGPI